MRTAVIYTRVSTEEQARTGMSLEFQEDLLRKYCAMQDIQIYHEFQDPGRTAKNFNRPGFKKLLEYIRRHRKVVDLVLFTKWDRFSRNITDALNMIRDIQGMNIEPQAIQQPIDFSIPQNKFMLAFYLTEPEVNNDVKSQNVTEALRKRLEKGGWVNAAPAGYVNARTAENLPTLVPGPKARIIREGYEMIARGETQKAVRRFFRVNGCPHSKDRVKHILTSEVYTGMIYMKAYKKEPAQWIKGLHDPIIDPDLFQRAQRAMSVRSRATGKRIKYNPLMPLRGHLTCRRCGGNLTGSESKGKRQRYAYYHCRKGCPERIPAQEVNEAFSSFLRKMTPRSEVVNLYRSVMEDIFASQGDRGENRLRQIEKEIKKVEERLFRTDELYIDGKIPHDRYEAFGGKLRKELAQLKTEQEDLQMLDTSYQKYLKFGFQVATHLADFYEWANIETKHKFMCSIFPQKVVYDGEGKCRTPQANEVIALFTGVEADFEEAKSTKAALLSDFCEMGTQERSRIHNPLITRCLNRKSRSKAAEIPRRGNCWNR